MTTEDPVKRRRPAPKTDDTAGAGKSAAATRSPDAQAVFEALASLRRNEAMISSAARRMFDRAGYPGIGLDHTNALRAIDRGCQTLGELTDRGIYGGASRSALARELGKGGYAESKGPRRQRALEISQEGRAAVRAYDSILKQVAKELAAAGVTARNLADFKKTATKLAAAILVLQHRLPNA